MEWARGRQEGHPPPACSLEFRWGSFASSLRPGIDSHGSPAKVPWATPSSESSPVCNLELLESKCIQWLIKESGLLDPATVTVGTTMVLSQGTGNRPEVHVPGAGLREGAAHLASWSSEEAVTCISLGDAPHTCWGSCRTCSHSPGLPSLLFLLHPPVCGIRLQLPKMSKEKVGL